MARNPLSSRVLVELAGLAPKTIIKIIRISAIAEMYRDGNTYFCGY